MEKQVVVIGAGPAGIEAAKAASSAGAQVTLVTDGPIGGRAGWHSLLPSKVWLAAVQAVREQQQIGSLGISVEAEVKARPELILARILAVSKMWNAQQRMELDNQGVEILEGKADFMPGDRVSVQPAGQVEDIRMNYDALILATGSVPLFPDGLQPDVERILAPRHAAHLKEIPKSILVIGAGATGCEFAYLFNRLGARVTWIIDEYGILPSFDPKAGKYLGEALKKAGVQLEFGQTARRLLRTETGVELETESGQKYPSEAAFIAIGRRPDLEALNLPAAGLPPSPKGSLQVDAYCRTSAPKIYAAGDVTGAPMLANKAILQGRIAGLHAGGGDPLPYREETVVRSVYTQPEIAQVGRLDSENARIVHLTYQRGLKAYLEADGEGFIRLAYDPENRRLLGALAAGHQAADMLAPAAMALACNANVDELGALGLADPTYSELAALAGRAAYEGP